MNTEIITSILAADFAIVLVYVAVRLSEICVKKMIRESEEDYLIFKHDFDTYMEVYVFCKRQVETERKLVEYAEKYPHTDIFRDKVLDLARWYCFRSQYPEQFMKEI